MQRWTLRIALVIILGALTTVAVAWACVVTAGNPTNRAHRTISAGESAVARGRWTTPKSTSVDYWTARGIDIAQVTEPAKAPIVDLARTVQNEAVNIVRAGFPARALGCELWLIDGGTGRLVTVLNGGWFGQGKLKEAFPNVLAWVPYRPIWPGFLFNLLFYALVWFGIVLSLAGARRAIRKQRGRCPRCAYQLRGELRHGCPECGWGRE